jgi:hypothetical protein
MGRTTNSYLNLTLFTNNSTTPVNATTVEEYGFTSAAEEEIRLLNRELALANKNNKGIDYNIRVIEPNKEITSIFSSRNTKFKFDNKRASYYAHKDENYQINPSEIVKWSQEQGVDSLKLSSADFAYLKDIGVYPNNRLIIARRFSTPVGNDLSIVQEKPIATLISWFKEDADFLNVTYGEDWVPAKASFKNILDDVGKDLTLPGSDNTKGMSKLGSFLAGGADGIPFPGLIEGLQYNFFSLLGYVDKQSGQFLIPNGDPNLIREAKQRSTIGSTSEAGSGLKCSFSISMTVEYEMKFINGVDPTIVYFDIIANALSFATSPSRFMFNDNFNQKGKDFINNLMSGNIQSLKTNLVNFLRNLQKAIDDLVKGIFSGDKTKNVSNTVSNSSNINTLIQNTLGAVVGKYKVALIGVLNSITGAHSTPWHVTIGNPKRPIFCSGDLYTEDVKMSMGPILGFNDLPSSIKLELTLKPARNLGADEIFERFNPSQGREYYSRAVDFWTEGSGNSATFSIPDDKISNQFNKSETPTQKEVRDIVRQSGNAAQAPGVDSRGRLTGRQGTSGGLN